MPKHPIGELTANDHAELVRLARRDVWWKTPDEALQWPGRLIARVMDIGDFDDVASLLTLLGEESFREALLNAEVLQFRPQSWSYWHYRFGMAEPGHVPPMPVRRLK